MTWMAIVSGLATLIELYLAAGLLVGARLVVRLPLPGPGSGRGELRLVRADAKSMWRVE